MRQSDRSLAVEELNAVQVARDQAAKINDAQLANLLDEYAHHPGRAPTGVREVMMHEAARRLRSQ